MTKVKMRSGFTLIELLVVIVIIAVIMGLVMPMGSKMLSSFEHYAGEVKEEHDFKLKHARAFLEAKTLDVSLKSKYYKISPKGVAHEYEKSDDDR